MKRSSKILIILGTPFVAGILLGFLLGFCVSGGCSRDAADPESDEPAVEQTVSSSGKQSSGKKTEEQPVQADSAATVDADQEDETLDMEKTEIIYYGPRLAYSRLFADLNERHLKVADSLGLKSIPKTRDEVGPRLGLVEIQDCEYYVVDDLKYSVPYLTRGGLRGLNSIARAFKDSLDSKQLLNYRLVVSSLLRTEEDVERLRRSGNPNASDQSAHCYGTTFDISYTRYDREVETDEFMQPYELTKVLGEVLRDQKASGNCIVKYEKSEHCFHITSLL